MTGGEFLLRSSNGAAELWRFAESGLGCVFGRKNIKMVRWGQFSEHKWELPYFFVTKIRRLSKWKKYRFGRKAIWRWKKPLHKLRSISDSEKCQFVLWIGSKRLIKRKKLDEYTERMYSLWKRDISDFLQKWRRHATMSVEQVFSVKREGVRINGTQTRNKTQG